MNENYGNISEALIEIDRLKALNRSGKKFKVMAIIFVILFAVVTGICIVTIFMGFASGSAQDKLKRENKTMQEEITQLKSDMESLKSSKSSLDSTIKQQKEKITALEKDKKELESEQEVLSEQVDWMNKQIVFVPDDNTDTYHKYSCKKWKESDSYWAFNIEYAKYLGHKKCTTCF